MTSTTDQWTNWRAALAGTRGPINADEPDSGFYETRSKNKATNEVTRNVVAYWYEAGGWLVKGAAAKLYCKGGSGPGSFMLGDIMARERWPYASKRPITKAVYDAVCAGKGWPDENAMATADRERTAATSDGAPRSNSAAVVDPDSIEALTERLDDLAREAEKLIEAGAAKTQAASDQAADLADRLRGIEKRADELRDKEKRPHMDAATAVQKKWAPIVVRADDCKARLKKVVVTPFLTAAAAEHAKATAAAIQTGKPAETVAPLKRTAGSTSSVALRPVNSALVEDWPKALAYFGENAKVRELIQQLANAMARQGTCPAGCKIETKQVAA